MCKCRMGFLQQEEDTVPAPQAQALWRDDRRGELSFFRVSAAASQLRTGAHMNLVEILDYKGGDVEMDRSRLYVEITGARILRSLG